MPTTTLQFANLLRRKRRVRAVLGNNPALPRMSVHRTLRHMYVQIIDDAQGKTLVSASDHSLKSTGKKVDLAKEVGTKIAELAKEKKIKAVRFDRGAFKFHGRVAALAEAARAAGLTF